MNYSRRNIILTSVLVLILIVLTGIAGALMLARLPVKTDRPPARVEYRIVGTAERVEVAFLNDEGLLDRREMTPPGSYRFRAATGRELSISVRRLSPTGAVGCALIVDGRTVQQVAPENERAGAVCAGVVR
jgi:hypothetical protein